MTRKNRQFVLTPLAAAALALAVTGCGGGDAPEDAVTLEEELRQEVREERQTRRTELAEQREEQPRVRVISEDPPDTRLLPRTSAQLEEPGQGLAMVIDGSSPRAFHQSLEWIAADTNEEQYTRLTGALQYMRMYSSVARQGNDALYASLDGLTGEEVIARAEQLMRERRGR